MKCDGCGGTTSVIDSRQIEASYNWQYSYVRRRRSCDDCGARFTTHEVSEEKVSILRTRHAIATLRWQLVAFSRELASGLDLLDATLEPHKDEVTA